jgi:hypothetical protein
MNESNLGFVRHIVVLAICVGGVSAITMSPVQAQGQPSCPCFTSETIDAAALSLWGVLQNDEPSPPVLPNEGNECTGPEGKGISRLETEFEIFTTSALTLEPQSSLSVGTGFIEEPVGACGIRIERVNDQHVIFDEFMFTVGGRGVASGEEGLTVGQVAVCQQEILKSNTWQHFCPDLLDGDNGED